MRNSPARGHPATGGARVGRRSQPHRRPRRAVERRRRQPPRGTDTPPRTPGRRRRQARHPRARLRAAVAGGIQRAARREVRAGERGGVATNDPPREPRTPREEPRGDGPGRCSPGTPRRVRPRTSPTPPPPTPPPTRPRRDRFCVEAFTNRRWNDRNDRRPFGDRLGRDAVRGGEHRRSASSAGGRPERRPGTAAGSTFASASPSAPTRSA